MLLLANSHAEANGHIVFQPPMEKPLANHIAVRLLLHPFLGRIRVEGQIEPGFGVDLAEPVHGPFAPAIDLLPIQGWAAQIFCDWVVEGDRIY